MPPLSIDRRVRGFTFTHNNYTDADQDRYRAEGDSDRITYLVFGREVAETGTPHLQGYVYFKIPTRFSTVCNRFPGAHIEIARDQRAAAAYCKKDDDFEEFGSNKAISVQGQRNDFEAFKEWLEDQEDWPTERLILEAWPQMYGLHGPRLLRMRDLLLGDTMPLQYGELKGWQKTLEDKLHQPPDDRKIIFVYDPTGGKGKTWFVKYWLTQYPETTQMLGVGKRDDLAFALSEDKKFYFFNVSRGQMQYLQYSVLESIKDRLIFSPKYASQTKRLVHQSHVVVMCNEYPDKDKLSKDRYHILNLEFA